jgi:cytoskeletal protein RodZ
MKIIGSRTGEPRGWPGYLFGGRVRTSTFALIAAFFVTWWVYYTYQPPAPAPAGTETQMVPPGFVPDPEYTWVPRTSVRERPTLSTTPTTTTTSEETPFFPVPGGLIPTTSGPTTTPSPTSSTAPSTATTTSNAPTTTVQGAPGATPTTSQRAQ